VARKNLGEPDERITFPGITEDIVELGDLTVGRVVQEPGWRWSEAVRPIVGGEWCQARHVGVVISGRFGALLEDGTTLEFGPDDVYELPPGHDGYTIGDKPAVLVEWSGLRAFAGSWGGFHGRVLLTLLFTDIVESTTTAVRLGDTAWREALSRHYHGARTALERFRGREIDTTGDGLLAVFDGPALALRAGAAIRDGAQAQGLQVRVGVHVGEAELIGAGVRGVAVHEAARIMAEAAPGEVLVSEVAKTLAAPSGLAFEDRGMRTLKGIPGERRVFAYVGG
jgi:class 3 adenylate cyclase